MAIQKLAGLRLGLGDITSTTDSEFFARTSLPDDVLDGKNGDVYLLLAGANSEIYFKRNGTWIPLSGKPFTETLVQSQVAAVATVFPAAGSNHTTMEYSIERGGIRRTGSLRITHDGANAQIAQYADVQTGDVGVNFDAQINGANLELLYDSDAQVDPPVLKFTIARWS